MEIDYERLRSDLINYFYQVGSNEMDEYGTAMQFFPVAVMDLSEAEARMKDNIAAVRYASNSRLEEIASMVGFDIDDYKKKGMRF